MSNIDGTLSLQAFLLGFAVVPVVLYFGFYAAAVYVVASAFVLRYIVGNSRDISSFALLASVISLVLGYGFASGLVLCIIGPASWTPFGVYLCLIAVFHSSEYYLTSIINPKSLNMNSFLLNKNYQYAVFSFICVAEYYVETHLYPDMKVFGSLAWLGLLLSASGEVIRKLAMLTAWSNFNHVIQVQLAKDHVLITHGIYAFCRHPSYLGFITWLVGTQILLSNPFCVVVYAIVAWRYFKKRIQREEITLLNFFGEEYVVYQKQVPSGIPFIRGVSL